MDLKINIIEAAAAIAENETELHYKMMYPELNDMKIYSMIWTEDTSEVPKTESCTFIYTDEAQEIFQNLYDAIFDLLIACKTPEDVKSRN